MTKPLCRSGFFALALALATQGAAPSVSGTPLRFPQATRFGVDGAALITENDEGAPLTGLQVFVAAGNDREQTSNNGVAALVAESIARTSVDGATLRDAITAAGGSVDYSVDGHATRFYLEAVGSRMPAIVHLFARAIAAPDFSPATFAASRAVVAAHSKDLDASAISTGIQMVRRAYYSSGAGLPALGTQASLASLDREQLQAFYGANYVRGGIVVSAVGEVDSVLDNSIRALVDALPAGGVSAVTAKANTIPESAPRIIAHRDVGAPYVVIGFGAPDPGSKDFGAMLIVESLLSHVFESSTTTAVGFRERSVGTAYLYDAQPASLVVYVNGTLIDPAEAVGSVVIASRSLAEHPLDAAALRRWKTVAEGEFVTDVVALSDRAYELGAFGSLGSDGDPLNSTLGSVEQASAADVQRIAKQYLQRYIVALVLPRTSSTGS